MSGRALLRLIQRRERLAAQLAQVDRRVAVESVDFSRSRGFLFPLRPEQIKRELEGQG